jgi:hypothetical protein
VSDYAETLLGFPLDEWYADSCFVVGLIHPEDCDETVASRRAAVAAGLGGSPPVWRTTSTTS